MILLISVGIRLTTWNVEKNLVKTGMPLRKLTNISPLPFGMFESMTVSGADIDSFPGGYVHVIHVFSYVPYQLDRPDISTGFLVWNA